jgi:hypothetical protein
MDYREATPNSIRDSSRRCYIETRNIPTLPIHLDQTLRPNDSTPRMKKPDILPAPRTDGPLPGEDKWNRERRAFQRLRPSLLRTHLGKYVAIHEGKVVDSGKDKIALALRAYSRFGYVPIFVTQVLAEPAPPVRIPSPRLLHSLPA